MDRAGRIQVFRDNLKYFSEGYCMTPHGRKVNLMPMEPIFYSRPFHVDAGNMTYRPETEISVVNDDCIEVAHKLRKQGYNVALLNMASLSNPGGGVENCSGAQDGLTAAYQTGTIPYGSAFRRHLLS